MSLTAYIAPSMLSGLSDVSVAPGAGQSGYPLIWDNSLGKWVASLLPVASISGLGTMATQNANAVTITGGAATTLTAVSVSRDNTSSAVTADCYSSAQFFHSGQFFGRRARGTLAAPQGVNNGDWIFYFAGLNRGTTGWASQGTGFAIVARANASDYPNDNRVPSRYQFQVMNATPAIVNCFEADSTGLNILTGSAATNTSTGALRVTGGIGCTGAIWNAGGLVATGARVNFLNLPTSDVGLAVGDLWRDGNNVKVKL